MTDDELDGLRDRAEVIAREAGALLMSAFRSPLAVRSKRTSSDLVTELDERCEALLRDRLEAAFPGTAIVGEEAGGERSEGPVWYVDPIVGTSNFAHGHPYFCISLGLWEGARPLAGVVHAFQTSSTGTSTSRSSTRSSFGSILITDDVTSNSPL